MPAVEHSFPAPIVFVPPSGVHTSTVILLHGRGGSAKLFSQRLLQTSFRRNSASEAPTTLFDALPDTKFVFPCARRQRATVYKRSVVRQWFDDWHLDPELASDIVDSRYDDGLQTAFLGESVDYLRRLIAEEAKLVGSSRKVVIGGFSQGAATSLIASLLWDGSEPLGGVVTMSGWLPYMKQMTDIFKHPSYRTEAGDQADIDLFFDLDPVGHPTGDLPDEDSHTALVWLSQEIELPFNPRLRPCRRETTKTPFMVCHGARDQQVEPQQGEQACLFLPSLGLYPVSWKCYEDIDHDYSESMVSDIARFLQNFAPSATSSLVRSPGAYPQEHEQKY